MKVIACELCEAVFQIKHSMDESYYRIVYCSFCGEKLDAELEDDIEDWEDYE
jgi:hypothetical protein